MNKSKYKEFRFFNDTQFPLYVAALESKNNDTMFQCHWHNELEFVIITKGSALFKIDNSSYIVSQGEAIFVSGSEIHTAHSLKNEDCCAYAIIFDPGLICGLKEDAFENSFFKPLVLRNHIIPIHIKGIKSWEKEVYNLLYVIVQLYMGKPLAYELSVKAQFYRIFYYIISCNELLICEKNYSESLHKTEKLGVVIDYIHANYDKKIKVSQLASMSNQSLGHFYRFFKLIINQTPINYINCYRVSKAAMQLRCSEKNLTEIAMDTGFENYTHFIEVFKKHMECTPSEYRKINNKCNV